MGIALNPFMTNEEGDTIVGFDGKPTNGIDDLHKLLTDERIGRRSSVVVIRGTQKLELSVTPQESQTTARN
jgi:S1-C subfamily serine protease